MPFGEFVSTVAREVFHNQMSGVYSEIPCLYHASLIYGLPEENIYEEVKKAESSLISSYVIASSDFGYRGIRSNNCDA